MVGAGISASRALFGPDGKLYVTVGGAFQFAQNGEDAQNPANHVGKLIRLNADGSVPDDNPFVGEAGHLPEIFSMGHRNQIGIAFHPDTGELWATENGPQGGDEANIIRAGGNYGWPLASFSRQYGGPPVTETPWRADFTGPEIVWWPSIAPSGLTFYTGEHFPAWQGNLFVGSMMVGRMERTGHLERIVFNRYGQEIRRESLLTELRQRIRDVRQGPDGYLYVLTEEEDAVLLRIEPARAITAPPGSIVPAVRLREPRVPPLPESEWTDRERAVVAEYAPGGEAGNALRTLLRAPGLAERIFPFLNYSTGESTLPPRPPHDADPAHRLADAERQPLGDVRQPRGRGRVVRGRSNGGGGRLRRRVQRIRVGADGLVRRAVPQRVGHRRHLGRAGGGVRRPQPDGRRGGRGRHHGPPPRCSTRWGSSRTRARRRACR